MGSFWGNWVAQSRGSLTPNAAAALYHLGLSVLVFLNAALASGSQFIAVVYWYVVSVGALNLVVAFGVWKKQFWAEIASLLIAMLLLVGSGPVGILIGVFLILNSRWCKFYPAGEAPD